MADPSGSGTNINEDECSISMDVQDQNPTLIDYQESFVSAKLLRQATVFLRNLSKMKESTDKVSVSESADDLSRSVAHAQDYARYRQMYLRMYCPFAPEKRKESIRDKTKKLLMKFKLGKKKQKKPKTTSSTHDSESERKHKKSATDDSSTASQRRPLVARVRRFFGCGVGNLDVLDFPLRNNSAVTPVS